MLLTQERLREKVTNPRLLPILQKILVVTDGLSKPGTVRLSDIEMTQFLNECAAYHPHPTTVIGSILGNFFVMGGEDSNRAFYQKTGLSIRIEPGEIKLWTEKV